jgi:hypothetical protein
MFRRESLAPISNSGVLSCLAIVVCSSAVLSLSLLPVLVSHFG